VTPDSPALKLWIVLSRAYHALEVLVKADVARYGLTPTEFGALEALYHKGPLLLGSVQQKILVSSGGVTYVIDRLRRGWSSGRCVQRIGVRATLCSRRRDRRSCSASSRSTHGWWSRRCPV
jgi:hypothetical protein